MVLNPREEDPHGVGSVVQEGDSCSVQLLGQFVDVCLQLGKGWAKDKRVVRIFFFTFSSSFKTSRTKYRFESERQFLQFCIVISA